MSVLRARYRNGAWQISISHEKGSNSYDSRRLQMAMERGSHCLRRFWERLGRDAGVWQLEYPKAAIGEGEMAVGNADLLAQACYEEAVDAMDVEAPRSWLNVRSARCAMRVRGLRVHGYHSQRLRDRVVFVTSALLAAAWLFGGILRYGRDGGRLPAHGNRLFAVHGEWTNRTRHLLSLIRDGAVPSAIIVLGRSRQSLQHVRKRWEDELGVKLPPIRRPFSFAAAFRAIPESVRLLGVGYATLAECPYLPPFRELMAMAYRAMYGAVSGEWWREQTSSARTIYYGHTGTADTTGLELAQQKSAVETVHVVHGISSGLNFTGLSSIALFRCGHDARWHTTLGGYGRCLAKVAHRPACRRGAEGLLLLTNLAHPMNPWFRVTGIDDEARVLKDVAAVSEERLGETRRMLWKPHPATSTLPEDLRRDLSKRALAFGYRQLPPASDLVELAGQARWVLCTASTVVIDLLAYGFLPVMLEWQAINSDAALAQYPLRARDRDELSLAMDLLEDVDQQQELFLRAWGAIEPSAPGDLGQIERKCLDV